MILENVYIVVHRYTDEYQEKVTEIDRVCDSVDGAIMYAKEEYNLSNVQDFRDSGYCKLSDDDEIWIQMETVY